MVAVGTVADGTAGGGMSTTTGSTSTIYIGQLVLDMYKPADKDLVWRRHRQQDPRSEGKARKAAEESQ